MPKVHLIPSLPAGEDPGDGGIRRVIVGQHQTLPAHGWEITDDPAQADLIACHVEIPPTYMRLYGDKPFVVHNHGFYWTDGGYEWDAWSYGVNQKAMASIRVADAVTAVSEWTANAIRRASMRDTRVVYHGVDLEEWQPLPLEERSDYVLWNKTRIDPICDPGPMNAAAALLPRVHFVSTLGNTGPNIELTGRLPFERAKDVIRHAAVYLATTRETFGIGTLEALACGIPVVGYAFGGQVEIVEHGVDGWLVRPGDTEGLAEGIEWALAHRDVLSANARAKAEQFPVERSGDAYASLYDEVLSRHRAKRVNPRTSVIVPVYKMGDYLDDTLASVLAQTDPDWECVIVNDASPDERDHEIAQRYVEHDQRFREIVLEQNGYLANARNVGIANAHGRYILPLDADDMLAPLAVETLAAALDDERGLHIVYGNVLFVEADGRTPISYVEGQRAGLAAGHSGWPVRFNLEWMLRGPGQLMPYSSMFRREVWDQTGGYRTRSRSSEDQDFWLRATSYGFTADMVTLADVLVYRVRPDSMSSAAGEGWEDHRGWFPWCDPQRRDLIPAGAIQEGKPVDQLPLPALDPSPIAVVIPVGPGHAKYVYDAIDSVEAQTFRNWECIVVNDSGEELPPLPAWVKIVEGPACEPCHGSGAQAVMGVDDEMKEYHRWAACSHCGGTGHARFGGVAAARNAGIASTRAATFLPLDADDYLQPHALQLFWDFEVSEQKPAVIYSDFWEDPGEQGHFRVYETPDYDPWALIQRGALHAVTALTPRAFWEAVGGYDTELAWEDWALSIAIAAKGWCSRRIAAPLFTYRKHTGMRRNENLADFEESKRAIMRKDFGLQKEGELLACSSCGAGRATTQLRPPVAPAGLAGPGGGEPPDDYVTVEYIGTRAGSFRFKSSIDPRVSYSFSSHDKFRYVHKTDVQQLLTGRGDFRVVERKPVEAAAMNTDAPALVAARTPVMTGAVPGPTGFSGISSSGGGARVGAPVMERPAVEAPAAVDEPAAPRAPVAPPPPSAKEAVEAKAEVLAKKHSREELDAQAKALGIAAPESLANKTEVAKVIVVRQEMGL